MEKLEIQQIIKEYLKEHLKISHEVIKDGGYYESYEFITVKLEVQLDGEFIYESSESAIL